MTFSGFWGVSRLAFHPFSRISEGFPFPQPFPFPLSPLPGFASVLQDLGMAPHPHPPFPSPLALSPLALSPSRLQQET